MMIGGMTGEMTADMMTAEVVVTDLGVTGTDPDPGLLIQPQDVGPGPAAEVQALTGAKSILFIGLDLRNMRQLSDKGI